MFLNALDDGSSAVFQFAQIAEARFEFTQLNVVQAAGHLFAVTGNERHGRATIEQLNGRAHLGFGDLDFVRQLAGNFLHVFSQSNSLKRAILP